MAKTWGFRVDGIEDATAALRKVGDALAAERVQDALLVGAQMLRDRAKRYVRIGAGMDNEGDPRMHLRDAIFATKGKLNRIAPSVIVGVSYFVAPHAHLVEGGHINWKLGRRKDGRGYEVKGPTPAHPYMQPALEASRVDMPALITDMLKRTLQAFGIDVI